MTEPVKKRTKKLKDVTQLQPSNPSNIYTPSIPFPPTPPPEPEPEPEPEPDPDPELEPSEPLIQDLTAPNVPMSVYLQLYRDNFNLQNELIKAKRQIINLQTEQAQWLKKKSNPNAHELKEKLIDLILESPLNIESIDDHTERQIYMFILTQLDNLSTNPTKCCAIM
jgi:hypothetical protein